MDLPTKEQVLHAIRECGRALGRAPSRAEFKSRTGMTENQMLQHFPSWREAVRAAGWQARPSNVRLSDEELLREWGEHVRRLRRLPTRDGYRRDGKFSPGVFEKHFGPWSSVPVSFCAFADGKAEWADVVALLPVEAVPDLASDDGVSGSLTAPSGATTSPQREHAKLTDRPTYGNPMDFQGLRHEPVNEGGVVFLFGMVARELGRLARPLQAGDGIACGVVLHQLFDRRDDCRSFFPRARRPAPGRRIRPSRTSRRSSSALPFAIVCGLPADHRRTSGCVGVTPKDAKLFLRGR